MKYEIKKGKGQELWKKAKKLIPGGTQLLSKRSEMFLPDNWPSFYDHAKGVEIWDLDGNKYIDMSLMGVSACTLGYADDDVNKSVKAVIDKGSAATLNPPEDVELAELLIKIHPWAGMVRYSRTGGEAVAIAIRIARTHTKKDKIAFCGYHGWHDWYLASNLADDSNLDGNLMPGLEPRGVPRQLTNTTIPFEYNNIDSLKKLFEKHKGEIGVIIMEPLRHSGPENDFLKKVREEADKQGAVLIFDEISSAWKQNVGGVHLLLGVNPDIAVFSKAISNGFPMGVVLGTSKVMDSAQDTFISSTQWTERIGPTAAIATIKKMQEKNVPAHLKKIGTLIGDGWAKYAKKHGIKLKILGPEALVTFALEYENKLEILTLYNQEMLKRGYLTSDHVFVSLAHTEKHVKEFLEKVDEVFEIIGKAIKDKKVKDLLEGPVVHRGFKRLVW
ncbi:MAG: aminotransferase class III-fold pyridoxal phosphate-dependent enzyme [Nanoarchaeota archaeon]|nr:aminotransferase class III-fold pyridoxal phosphate-dependent enzyme [Nanoarchaeota archaeon]MBU1321069.1 aminotransferase class III-fold pyridoxal phosphate-dependent enzyme [Nanoarchaeota archaeon]MBU1597074.1 aminotransferase class III-fold pyridoxal phosphate-dependent enzyme [Nanoarchaeota archaeon]MBU2440864.1 aminotransferase class III-fold pyridoxal phosphate-dependent enzyme [Nanoarchaeota archaeon]